jgi:hypothetical protein
VPSAVEESSPGPSAEEPGEAGVPA